jgi:hypothetical protein
MILSFKTKINGKHTYFVEKIWKSLQSVDLSEYFAHIDGKYLAPTNKRGDFNAKLHTIRTDEKDRWETGVLIDFFINARQKNMFRFAPRIPVVSRQRIYMSYAFNDVIEITIGKKYIADFKEKEQLAINDGFDSYEDFFNYFYPIIKSSKNEFYKGKIIHWTDLRY